MYYFNLKFHNTTVKNEIFAGISMFMAMSYILVVCPLVLSSIGMDYNGVFLATVCVSGFTTIVSGFYTKLPIAMAPGLGMTTMFVNLALSEKALSWRGLLLATYTSGIIICAFVRFGIFDKIMSIMDESFRRMIMCGVGFALFLYGVSMTGLLEKQDGYYVIGQFDIAQVFICAVSIIVIYCAKRRNKKGFVLLGLVAAYLMSIIFNYSNAYETQGISLMDYIESVFKISYDAGDISHVMFEFPDVIDFFSKADNIILFIDAVLLFTLGHFFDAIGTNTSCFDAINSDIDSRMKDTVSLKRVINVDGIGNIVSGVMGTPSVTTYGESLVGIVCGGKTGITALTTGCLFLLCFFFAPLFTTMELYVAAPALMYVGLSLLMRIRELDRSNLGIFLFGICIIIYLGFSFNVGYAVLYGLIVYKIIQMILNKQRATKEWWIILAFAVIHIVLRLVREF